MTFLKDESGQGMVEYALIIGLIAVVAVVGLALLGPRIRNMFTDSDNALTTTAAGGGAGA